MLGLLPLLALALLIVTFRLAIAREYNSRETTLLAAGAWGVILALATEILSLFHALSFWPLLLFWAGVCAVNIFWIIPSFKKNTPTLSFARLKGFRQSLKLSRFEIVCLLFIIFILLTTGILALVAAPNNWDSLTYHLSRVAHWSQNQTVATYPTSIARQVLYMPFAEYVILHFQILNHHDHWANSIQWLAFLGCLLAASLLAKELSIPRPGQFFSALLAATLPMAILQSTSTQNDLVVSFWLLGCIYFLLRSLKTASAYVFWATGIFLALALLTKGTAYLLAPCLLIIFILGQMRVFQSKKLLQFLSILLISFLVINAGHLTRYGQLHQRFIQAGFRPDQDNVFNKNFSLSGYVSILIRAMAMEMNSPLLQANTLIERGVTELHRGFKLNLADERTSLSTDSFSLSNHPLHEDYAGAPLHFILFILVIGIFLSQKREEKRALGNYLLGILVTAAFFVGSMKWQLWGNRLHLPLLLLSCPFMAMVAIKFNRKVLWVIAVLFSVASLPWLFLNETRPLFGKQNVWTTPRLAQYFISRPDLFASYQQVAQYLNDQQCRQVGVIFGGDGWEYPLWATLAARKEPLPRVEHILVDNPTKDFTYPLGDFQPCLLVSDCLTHQLQVKSGDTTFANTYRLPFLTVFTPDETGALFKQSLLRQLKDSVNDSQIFMMQYNRLQQEKFSSSQDLLTLLNLYKKIIQQNALLSEKDLNALMPELGSVFQRKLIQGLNMLITGLRVKDEKAILEGQKWLGEWFLWLSAHEQELSQHF